MREESNENLSDVPNKEKTIKEEVSTNVSLFNIKVLNDISDKMIRGSLKKIYMAGKRAGKPSNVVVDEVLVALKKTDKLNEEIKLLLNSLK